MLTDVEGQQRLPLESKHADSNLRADEGNLRSLLFALSPEARTATRGQFGRVTSRQPVAVGRLARDVGTVERREVPTMSLVAEGVAEAASGGGLIQSFLLIFASEIGDKTFFMAGLLAAKYSRLISLAGSVGALAVMTVISCVIGRVFHAVPPGLTAGLPLDDYAAVVAFAYFGAKTLYDAYQLPDGDSSGLEEEAKEAEEAVNEVTKGERATAIAAIVQTFGLVFAAELGDRSFFTTIALSAALNPFAVALGAIAAHASATGLAVAGGALMSKYLSEKVIGYIGGSLFLVFAVTTGLGVF